MDATAKGNTLVDMIKFLSTEDRPVTSQEFTEFWKTLTEAEKAEFKAAVLHPVR